MSLIAQILPGPDHLLIDLDVSSKKRVFEQVGILFENRYNIARSAVFDSLFAREKLGSTGLGHGVAIPHGRAKGLKDVAGAFVRLKEAIPFDAPDGKPVNLSPKEYGVLLEIMKADGSYVNAEELFDTVWAGASATDLTDAIKTTVYSLRRKLGEGNGITSTRGKGYRLS